MARLDLDDLVEHFTLLPDEVVLLGDKAGSSRLGFVISSSSDRLRDVHDGASGSP